MKLRISNRVQILCAAFSMAAVGAHAQSWGVSTPDVVGGITYWRGVVDSAGTGYIIDTGGPSVGPDSNNPGLLDNQTGQKVADLVGTTSQPTLYIGYGQINGVDHIGFRMRLNVMSTLDNLKQSNYFGFDFGTTATNSNPGVVDMFVGLDVVSQQPSNWRVQIMDTTGTQATDNTSPSTTAIDGTPLFSTLAVTSGANANANYQQVTAANSIVGGATNFADASNTYPTGAPDAYLTFAVPFASFVAAARHANVMGPSFTFDVNTAYRVTAATGNQSNNINQDAMGAPSVAFNFSTPMNTSGTIGSTINPIPEPSTFALTGALLAPWLLRRRRRAAV